MPEAVKEVCETPKDLLKDDASDKIACKEVKSVGIPPPVSDSCPAKTLEEKDTATEDKPDDKSDQELKEENIAEQLKNKEETEENGTAGQTVSEVTAKDKEEQSSTEAAIEENKSEVQNKETDKNEEVGDNRMTEIKRESVPEKETNQAVENFQELDNSKKQLADDLLNKESKDSEKKVDPQTPNDEKPSEASEEVKNDNADGNNDSKEISQNSDDTKTIEDNKSNDKCPEDKIMKSNEQESVNMDKLENTKSEGEGMEVDEAAAAPSESTTIESGKEASVSVEKAAVEEVSRKENVMETEETTSEEKIVKAETATVSSADTNKETAEEMAVDKKESAEDTNMEIANEGSWKESETDDVKPKETKVPSSGEVITEATLSDKAAKEASQCTLPALKEVESKSETKEISDEDKSIMSNSDKEAVVSKNVEDVLASKETESSAVGVKTEPPVNEEKPLAPKPDSIPESDIAGKDEKAESDKPAGDGKVEKKEIENDEMEHSEGNADSQSNVKEEKSDSEPKSNNETTNIEVDKPVSVQNNEQEECTISLPVDTAGWPDDVDLQKLREVRVLVGDAREAQAVGNYFKASDSFAKACEIADTLRPNHENADLYFMYGCALLELAKNENTVLGDGVKENEKSNEQEEEANGDVAEEVNGVEEMEVDEPQQEAVDGAKEDESKNKEKENGTGKDASSEEEGESTKEEEEEDTNLKAAWEILEIAKVIYEKTGNNERLADTYMKLGEAGMESENKEAIDDMKKALDLRMKEVPVNDRLVAEIHFNIALAYHMFEQSDEAIEALKLSKSILETRIENLQMDESEKAKLEIKEIKDLLPDLEEKIQDIKDYKEGKERNKEEVSRQLIAALNKTGTDSGTSKSAAGAGEVSNISHLVKRKRKLEDVTSDLLPSSKHPCPEKANETDPTDKPDN